MSELDFSTTLLNLINNYSLDIDQFTFLRKITDHMFVKTKRFYTFMFLLYTFNFAIFITQISLVTGDNVKTMLMVQLVIQIFFFINELIQIAD